MVMMSTVRRLVWAGRAEAVGSTRAARVVVELPAPTGSRVARASGAAGGALDEPPEKITAVVLPVRVAFVLREHGLGPLPYPLVVHYGRHRLLYDVFSSVCFDPVDARVG